MRQLKSLYGFICKTKTTLEGCELVHVAWRLKTLEQYNSANNSLFSTLAYYTETVFSPVL